MWGNPAAVRIPRSVVRSTGLRVGDCATFAVTDDCTIEISPEPREHRRIAPARGVTFNTLFADYSLAAKAPGRGAWPNDDLVGAKRDAWLQ